ncbi:FAD:protein FMN transferase [Herbiconiux sp. L3-i23]|uniref:FAD:protein FMN transferase n=1 Tax=Herbiconiux sp. L3-i23 TaxID=2905871 RepID=UPI00205C4DDA|nr:FAD:protein FMN transferase [Herbiconiux sp. L3-i23]BDI23306.1 FAD:protein FMN transferase [Herbiconiux sp. L3-i23]
MQQADAALHTLRFDAIGTGWQIDTAELLTPAQRQAVHQRVETFDAAYSRFRADSLVTALAENGGTVLFPDDLPPMLEVYRTLSDATDGRMTPLVGSSLEQLGYDAAYSLVPAGPAIGAPDWESALEIDGSAITATSPVLLDFGAAGKGYLVDLVAGALEEAGVAEATIDAGGDLLHHAPGPLRVALEHPYDATKAIGVVEITGGAICGSAVNRRAWGNGLHHVVDGLTGEPVHEVAAAWAIADDALHADALATALFFTDAATLAERTGWRFDAVRMMTDGTVSATSGLPGEVFTR